MGDVTDGQWSVAFPYLTGAGTARRHCSLLQQAETAHRTSAQQLRLAGRLAAARKAESYAAWTRFGLDEPEIAQRLYGVIKAIRAAPRLRPLAGQALDGALRLLKADRGNLQLADPATGALHIAAQCGFDAEFLDYFSVVHDDGTACGRAASQRSQTVITDVTSDPGFAVHREMAAAAGFRAVQSTPLTGRDGTLVGIISTHYPRPYRPPDRDLRLVERYADLIGQSAAQPVPSRPD